MNSLTVFNHTQFGEIRTATIDNEPWFVGKDVAEALGYGAGKSLANAVANHVDAEDKGVIEMMTPGGKQNVTIINESGLYSLIMSSKLPSAKQFKRWVTHEVLPSIRRLGSYTQPNVTNRMRDDALLDQLRKTQEHLNSWRELAKTFEALTKDSCSRYDRARKDYDECRANRDKCRKNVNFYQKQMDALMSALTLPATE